MTWGMPEPDVPFVPPGMGPQAAYLRRILAFIIDSVLISVVAALVYLPLIWGELMREIEAAPAGSAPSLDGFSFMLKFWWITPLQWLLIVVYNFVQEGFMGGQTLGKRITGVRVFMADGTALTHGAAFKRSLMRIVDQQIPLAGNLVGLVASLTNPTRRRLGDRVARTIVVDARFVPLAAPYAGPEWQLPGLAAGPSGGWSSPGPVHPGYGGWGQLPGHLSPGYYMPPPGYGWPTASVQQAYPLGQSYWGAAAGSPWGAPPGGPPPASHHFGYASADASSEAPGYASADASGDTATHASADASEGQPRPEDAGSLDP